MHDAKKCFAKSTNEPSKGISMGLFSFFKKSQDNISPQMRGFIERQISAARNDSGGAIFCELSTCYLINLIALESKETTLNRAYEILKSFARGEDELISLHTSFQIIPSNPDTEEMLDATAEIARNEYLNQSGDFLIRAGKQANIAVQKMFEPDPDFHPGRRKKWTRADLP